jgi:hypothetical protein
MKVFNNTPNKIFLASWVIPRQPDESTINANHLHRIHPRHQGGVFQPLRNWLDHLQVSDRQLAHRLCRFIPAQCPFERDVKLFGKKLFHIPPMCKLNPVYEELVGIRFRALCYLADNCQEDISQYH